MRGAWGIRGYKNAVGHRECDEGDRLAWIRLGKMRNKVCSLIKRSTLKYIIILAICDIDNPHHHNHHHPLTIHGNILRDRGMRSWSEQALMSRRIVFLVLAIRNATLVTVK